MGPGMMLGRVSPAPSSSRFLEPSRVRVLCVTGGPGVVQHPQHRHSATVFEVAVMSASAKPGKRVRKLLGRL